MNELNSAAGNPDQSQNSNQDTSIQNLCANVGKNRLKLIECDSFLTIIKWRKLQNYTAENDLGKKD